jgi:hypothetical protein
VDRRGLLLGAGAALGLPRFALGADDKKYEAMILGCIDPRLQTPVRRFALDRGLIGRYASSPSPARRSARSRRNSTIGTRPSGTTSQSP